MTTAFSFPNVRTLLPAPAVMVTGRVRLAARWKLLSLLPARITIEESGWSNTCVALAPSRIAFTATPVEPSVCAPAGSIVTEFDVAPPTI